MATRRMFSLKVVDTDEFLEMPQSTQLLYFHLNMRADDDGFVSNPKKISKTTGSGEDDLKILSAKKFIIPFERGICVIRHWHIHNLIRSDRYIETDYIDEKKTLVQKNGRYEPRNGKVIPDGNQVQPQVRLGKVRIGDNIHRDDEKIPFASFWEIYPKKVEKKKSELRWGHLKRETQEIVLADIPKRKLGRKWRDGFVESPAVYLNGERWDDEIEVEHQAATINIDEVVKQKRGAN